MQITLEMKIKDSKKKLEKIAYPDALNAFLRGLHNTWRFLSIKFKSKLTLIQF